MYYCPMHPEVKNDAPGRCPKCGMKLIQNVEATTYSQLQKDVGLGRVTWKSYIPLIVVIALILSVAVVVSLKDAKVGMFSVYTLIENFMVGFFIVFAGFKLIDLHGFAEGYSTYDLLARRFLGYGYVYPFLELGFGLAMLVGVLDPGLLWAEVIVMGFSGVGVLIKLLRHETFQCVCLGTLLKVPLTKVTLIEDFGMAVLAMVLLIHH